MSGRHWGRMKRRHWISIETHKKFFRARSEFADWTDREWKHPVSCFFAGLGILDVCFSWAGLAAFGRWFT